MAITAPNIVRLRPTLQLSELIRRRVRAVLPVSAYSQLSRALDLCCGIRKIGIEQYRHLRAPHGPTLRGISVPGFAHPFWVRSRGSDIDQFVDTIVRESYGQYL